MNRKIAGALLAASALLLAGCGRTQEEFRYQPEDNTTPGVIGAETSTLAIDPNSEDFIEQLADGWYYVVHDGLYYPVVNCINNNDPDDTEVSHAVQSYFTTENEFQIPTLFDGDKLVYYSTATLLDHITWTRMSDYGYTLGVYNVQTMKSDRAYLDLEEDCVVPASEIYGVYNIAGEANEILLDKLGGAQITGSTFLENGLFLPTTKGATYDLDLYVGTRYAHTLATANVHAFVDYERYASIEYECLQEYFYEVKIPDYFVSGYYRPNAVGMFRLVRGTSFDENTDFNERVLFPKKSEIAKFEEKGQSWEKEFCPYVYSEFDALNQFQTDWEGAVGYVDPEAAKYDSVLAGLDESVDGVGAVVLKEATVKNIDVWFPKGYEAQVSIKSPTKETTGDIYIRMDDGSIKVLNYNRLEGTYRTTLDGKNQIGTLTISGLYKSYDIELIGCQQYTGQDKELEAEQTESTEEENSGEDGGFLNGLLDKIGGGGDETETDGAEEPSDGTTTDGEETNKEAE